MGVRLSPDTPCHLYLGGVETNLEAKQRQKPNRINSFQVPLSFGSIRPGPWCKRPSLFLRDSIKKSWREFFPEVRLRFSPMFTLAPSPLASPR